LSILEKPAGGVNDLLVRHANEQLGKPTPMSYSAELLSFVLTIHSYLPHAHRI